MQEIKIQNRFSPLLKEGGIAMRYAAMTGDWHTRPTNTRQ